MNLRNFQELFEIAWLGLSFLLGSLSLNFFWGGGKGYPLTGRLFDVLKGALAVVFALPVMRHFLLDALMIAPLEVQTPTPWTIWMAGLFVILGDCFSPWKKAQGAQGFAPFVGAFAVLAPQASIAGLLALGLLTSLGKPPVVARLATVSFSLIIELVLHPLLAPELWVGVITFFVILAQNEKEMDLLLEEI